MYRSSDFKKDRYKTGEVAKLLNVTNNTIINYDKAGKLKVNRSETNQRVIFRDDLLEYLRDLGQLTEDNMDKADVIYARVSGHKQKEKGDLDRQVVHLIESNTQLHNPVVLKEVGSGLNDKRPLILKLIRMVMNDEVNKVYVTYKDRLTRYGFNYLKEVFQLKGVEIVVMEDRDEKKASSKS